MNEQNTPPPSPHTDKSTDDSIPLSPFAVVDTILKHPGRIMHELNVGRGGRIAASLLLISLVCLGVYGLVAGSLSGGEQLWAAPAKIALGTIAAALICLPSLYIFLCLGGTDARLSQIAGSLLSMVSLMALLLLGFAPVAWVFSQSTDSVALMTNLHLVFWLIGIALGSRLLVRCVSGNGDRANVRVWLLIYCVVSLQMMTALRPIIGKADTFIPIEKRFFLAHWFQTMGGRL